MVLDRSAISSATHGPVDVSGLEMTATAFVLEIDDIVELTDLGGVDGESQHIFVLSIIKIGGIVYVENGKTSCAVEVANLPLRAFEIGFSLGHLTGVFVGLVILRRKVHEFFFFLCRFVLALCKSDGAKQCEGVSLSHNLKFIITNATYETSSSKSIELETQELSNYLNKSKIEDSNPMD